MPLYDYQHLKRKPANCDELVEVFQSMSDEPLTACPKCGKPVRRVISAVAGHVNKMSGTYLKERGFTKLVRRDKGVYEKE